MSSVLYAPNVHLFAFHLWEIEDKNLDPDYQTHYLRDRTLDIFKSFDIAQQLNIRQVNSNLPCIDILEGTTEDNILIALEGKLEDKKIAGVVAYLKLYDSYGLYLNLRIPELNEHQNRTKPVDVEIFNQFNQNQQFILESSIGQVVILTGWLSKEQQQQEPKDWQNLADSCVQSFLKESAAPFPACYQVNQLFGSPIFEYGDPRNPDRYDTIWVWLFFDESEDREKPSALAESNLCLLDREFIDLFFYRQKVIRIFDDSRQTYKDSRQQYKDIKTEVENIGTLLSERQPLRDNLPKSTIFYLQQSLIKLLELDVGFSENLRSLENARLTLEANAKNYRQKLAQIQTYCAQEKLDFLENFHNKNCANFKAQMKLDLGYFTHAGNLADKAIASIRGIVEIEQTQRDRQRQAQEKSLENNIQALGIAIATGAIFASSAALIDDNFRLPWASDRANSLHPFTIAFFGGLGCAIFIYGLVKLWQKCRHRKTDN